MDVVWFRRILEERRRLKIAAMEREAVELARIDEALFRIERGTYGLCEDCGRPIEKERLEPLPDATRCAEDARREEAA